MTGLNLETFLRLLRADLAAWVSLGAVVCVVVLMTWTSWGTRRALRKCLVLSLMVHAGALLYGGGFSLQLPLSHEDGEDGIEAGIRQIRVSPIAPEKGPGTDRPGSGLARRRLADWDLPASSVALSDPPLGAARPEETRREPSIAFETPATEAPHEVEAPTVNPPEVAQYVSGKDTESPVVNPPAAPKRVAPANENEIPLVVVEKPKDRAENNRSEPDRLAPKSPDARKDDNGIDHARQVERVRASRADGADLAMPEVNLRRRERPTIPDGGDKLGSETNRPTEAIGQIALARTVPVGSPRTTGIPDFTKTRVPQEIPEVYRSRLDPDRSALAQRSGASEASEAAVARALDWLARHQDADGRWNGGAARYKDDSIAAGETSFTMHCPPGEICSGECFYWEADTAMTGLALLAYLGAGHTHLSGKHAATIKRGLQYLVQIQKPDGDLRSTSVAVGMYCHSMAALTLCEAYALTGDDSLRGPAERAVAFLVKARATDGMAWRYSPGAMSGDTSILGWVILVMKSAKEVGIPVPATVRAGALTWLNKIAEGDHGGLAVYRPGEKITPTMTAEAWVCRQFLGVGGPGPASTETARYLSRHSPAEESYNLYYLYYGTLGMYQHGGSAWNLWNSQVRDALVRRQKTSGHQEGSWDPQDSQSQYDVRGGRIYCTAMATLTLEVYYRYLRLYNDPVSPRAPAPSAPDERFAEPPTRRIGDASDLVPR